MEQTCLLPQPVLQSCTSQSILHSTPHPHRNNFASHSFQNAATPPTVQYSTYGRIFCTTTSGTPYRYCSVRRLFGCRTSLGLFHSIFPMLASCPMPSQLYPNPPSSHHPCTVHFMRLRLASGVLSLGQAPYPSPLHLRSVTDTVLSRQGLIRLPFPSRCSGSYVTQVSTLRR